MGFTIGGGQKENGEVLEESESEDEERPPPIPPRNNSLSPEQTSAIKTAAQWEAEFKNMEYGATKVDIYGDNPFMENGAGHFLGGRGGGKPPPDKDDENPPPIPPKARLGQRRAPPTKPPRSSHQDDEAALLAELEELEKRIPNPLEARLEGKEEPKLNQDVEKKEATTTATG